MDLVYYTNSQVTIYYDAANSTGRAVWEGFLSGEDLREPVRQCLQLINTEKPSRWLADNRKLRAIRQHDQEWLEANLMPQLAASSIRKMATLVSDDIFGQMAIDSLYSKATAIINFDHHYFKDEIMARLWLIQPVENYGNF